MSASRSAALALTTALFVAACSGGGDDNAATTTSASIEDTTSTSILPTTTTIDPALRELLLVAEDLSGFKEQTTAEPADPEGSNAPVCGDPAIAPAGRALDDDPFVDGPTLVRGADDAVEVSSSVVSSTPEKAEAAMKEALDPKGIECLEGDFRTVVEKDLPAGTTLEFKTATPTESSVAGTDQAILVASTVTVKAAGTTSTLRVDFVFLRKAGIIYSINYLGPTTLATSAERQRIVAIAAKKLAGDSGTSTTAAAGGSSTSSRGSTSSTRRGSTTTRQGGSTSSSRSTTSTTR